MTPSPTEPDPANRGTNLREAVAEALGESVATMDPLRGGDVAEAYRVRLATGTLVFAKTHAAPPPNFFTTEATGLAWLRKADAVHVPEVLAVSDGDAVTPPMLVLEWIDEATGVAPDEEAFGRGLAELHRAGAPCFGREDRRTTGSRGLPNEPCRSWSEFYASQRLLPLARLVRDGDHIAGAVAERLEGVARRLEDLAGAAEPAALLHGDLWAGNRLVDRNGESWLIDPACFGGHREFDLAMMRLFGGFGEACYRAYEEAYPLGDGWRERIPLHQLAPLAVHAVKFGGGYVAALDRALRAVS